MLRHRTVCNWAGRRHLRRQRRYNIHGIMDRAIEGVSKISYKEGTTARHPNGDHAMGTVVGEV